MDYNSRMAQEFFDNLDMFLNASEFELHLPQLAITGTKKCGTYALLEFLLAHPKIRGSLFPTKEFTFTNTGRFEVDFAAFYRTLKFARDPQDERSRLVKIVGFNNMRDAFEAFARKPETGAQSDWMKAMVNELTDWFDSVRIIHSFCDPVKRLQSEFVHVTSSHDKNWTIGKCINF